MYVSYCFALYHWYISNTFSMAPLQINIQKRRNSNFDSKQSTNRRKQIGKTNVI